MQGRWGALCRSSLLRLDIQGSWPDSRRCRKRSRKSNLAVEHAGTGLFIKVIAYEGKPAGKLVGDVGKRMID